MSLNNIIKTRDLIPDVSKIRENNDSLTAEVRNNGLRGHSIMGRPSDTNDVHEQLNEMGKRLHDIQSFLISVNRFHKTKAFIVNPAAYVAPVDNPTQVDSSDRYSRPQPLVNLNLNGMAIQSVYFENGSNAVQKIYGSADGSGIPLMSVTNGTWRIFAIGDHIENLVFPVAGTAGLVRITVTDEIWTPNMGAVL